jgi:hypothetical protein
MPKSIWFPDDEFEQLVTLAKHAGFRVSHGRGSQLRLFVMAAANTACTGRGLQPPAKQVESTAKVINPAKVTGKRQPRQ